MWSPQLSGAFHLLSPLWQDRVGEQAGRKISRCQGGCLSGGPVPFPTITSQTLSLIASSPLVPFSFHLYFLMKGAGVGRVGQEMGWEGKGRGVLVLRALPQTHPQQ